MSSKNKVSFADLFAGIGGFHAAFHNLGAECKFVSEWDDHARSTYKHNYADKSPLVFGDEKLERQRFVGDITEINAASKQVPKVDILCAGFPCQPFSQAGEKLGMEEARGTLFFDILRFLIEKKPKAFFLENVRGLLTHISPGGIQTMDVIRKQLADAGYYFTEHLVRASDYGVPQHRPRVFIIGFSTKLHFNRFTPPDPIGVKTPLSEILGGKTDKEIGYTLRVGGKSSGIDDRRNWDTYLVDGKPKTIGPMEGLRLQGFPEWFEFPENVSHTQAMKQLGNSVAVPAVEAFARQMLIAMGREIHGQGGK